MKHPIPDSSNDQNMSHTTKSFNDKKEKDQKKKKREREQHRKIPPNRRINQAWKNKQRIRNLIHPQTNKLGIATINKTRKTLPTINQNDQSLNPDIKIHV